MMAKLINVGVSTVLAMLPWWRQLDHPRVSGFLTWHSRIPMRGPKFAIE